MIQSYKQDILLFVLLFYEMDDVKYELDEQRALAKSRLEELEALQQAHTNITKEYERLKLEVIHSINHSLTL